MSLRTQVSKVSSSLLSWLHCLLPSIQSSAVYANILWYWDPTIRENWGGQQGDSEIRTHTDLRCFHNEQCLHKLQLKTSQCWMSPQCFIAFFYFVFVIWSCSLDCFVCCFSSLCHMHRKYLQKLFTDQPISDATFQSSSRWKEQFKLRAVITKSIRSHMNANAT